MNIRSFFKFVEIQTTLASVIPFMMGTAYVLYRFQTFNLLNALIMFSSLMLFDFTTTAINNYIDFRTALKKDGYGYNEHNAMGKYNISKSTAIAAIVIMLIAATILGLVLFIRTNIVVLLLGIISFGIGVLYTYGPMPISRTPLGEIFSGLAQGIIIPFLCVYIHVFESQLVTVNINAGILDLRMDLLEIFYLTLFTLPIAIGISNIMLANNICDMEDDSINGRKTLAIVLGEKKSLLLFAALYFVGFIATALAAIIGIFPAIYLVALLSAVIVFKNVSLFFSKHIKSETFVLSIKNFIVLNILSFVLICLFIILK